MKPFTCFDCGNSLSYSGNMKSHQRIHSQERPFVCSNCGKSLAQSISLKKKHQRNHTGQKFACIQCDNSYTQSNNLTQHQRKHTEDKARTEPRKNPKDLSETDNITNAASNDIEPTLSMTLLFSELEDLLDNKLEEGD